jgi:hypothetical protein
MRQNTEKAKQQCIAMGYVVPERDQELLTRAGELGENRILAGMHSSLDVIGERVHGQAVAAASLYSGINSSKKAAADTQARSTLMAAVGRQQPPPSTPTPTHKASPTTASLHACLTRRRAQKQTRPPESQTPAKAAVPCVRYATELDSYG